MQFTTIQSILQKELAIEFRQKFAVGGVFLFSATVVFLLYKTFNSISPREWVLLLWIIMLFTGLQAVVKSFLQEKQETWMYYYTMFDATSLLVAKLLYNLFFLLLVFLFTCLCLTVFSGFPVRDIALFSVGSVMGLLGLSVIFTFISVMAASERASSILMSILSLPLTLPVLLLLIKVTTVSTGLLADTAVYDDVVLLAGINSMLLGSTFLLFPYVWRS